MPKKEVVRGEGWLVKIGGIVKIVCDEKGNIAGAKVAMRMLGLDASMLEEDGGPGSGNFGHAGRPGQIGGSAKRGIAVGEKTLKAIADEKKAYKAMGNAYKLTFAKKKRVLDVKKDPGGHIFSEEAKKHNMSIFEYLDYQMAKSFCLRKYDPYEMVTGDKLEAKAGEKGYVTPMKTKIEQMTAGEAGTAFESGRTTQAMKRTGASYEEANLMVKGLSDHFDNGCAVDEYIDKFIDADGMYEGAIYRWKNYEDDKLAKKMQGWKPGDQIGNEWGSNWSFSSDPEATKDMFGQWKEDTNSVCFVCEKNRTGAPVQCFSSFGDAECEVVTHSKTTWTVQSVEMKEKPNGKKYVEVKITEDDWHREKNIPVYKPEKKETPISDLVKSLSEKYQAKPDKKSEEGKKKDAGWQKLMKAIKSEK